MPVFTAVSLPSVPFTDASSPATCWERFTGISVNTSPAPLPHLNSARPPRRPFQPCVSERPAPSHRTEDAGHVAMRRVGLQRLAGSERRLSGPTGRRPFLLGGGGPSQAPCWLFLLFPHLSAADKGEHHRAEGGARPGPPPPPCCPLSPRVWAPPAPWPSRAASALGCHYVVSPALWAGAAASPLSALRGSVQSYSPSPPCPRGAIGLSAAPQPPARLLSPVHGELLSLKRFSKRGTGRSGSAGATCRQTPQRQSGHPFPTAGCGPGARWLVVGGAPRSLRLAGRACSISGGKWPGNRPPGFQSSPSALGPWPSLQSGRWRTVVGISVLVSCGGGHHFLCWHGRCVCGPGVAVTRSAGAVAVGPATHPIRAPSTASLRQGALGGGRPHPGCWRWGNAGPGHRSSEEAGRGPSAHTCVRPGRRGQGGGRAPLGVSDPEGAPCPGRWQAPRIAPGSPVWPRAGRFTSLCLVPHPFPGSSVPDALLFIRRKGPDRCRCRPLSTLRLLSEGAGRTA